MIDWTKPVRTKEGEPIEILTTKGRGDYPVLGYFPDSGDDFTMWTIDGKHIENQTSKWDLENTPELEAPKEFEAAYTEGFQEGFKLGLYRNPALIKQPHTQLNLGQEHYLRSDCKKRYILKKVVDV